MVLCEALDLHSPEQLLELETTARSAEETADLVEAFADGRLGPSHGTFDFSGFSRGRHDARCVPAPGRGRARPAGPGRARRSG